MSAMRERARQVLRDIYQRNVRLSFGPGQHVMTPDAFVLGAVEDALEAERRAALEEAAGLVDTMNDPAGDRASYEGRDMTCCETERMHALSHAAAAIRARINQTQGDDVQA